VTLNLTVYMVGELVCDWLGESVTVALGDWVSDWLTLCVRLGVDVTLEERVNDRVFDKLALCDCDAVGAEEAVCVSEGEVVLDGDCV